MSNDTHIGPRLVEYFKDQGYIKGTRERADPAYARRLSVETPAPRC